MEVRQGAKVREIGDLFVGSRMLEEQGVKSAQTGEIRRKSRAGKRES